MSNAETPVDNVPAEDGDSVKPYYMPTRTRWDVLELARDGSESAIDEFFRIYWPSVYAYFRARGLQEADAKDRTQGFFLRWIRDSTFASLSRDRGSFTRFLLVCLKNHHVNESIREVRKRNSPPGGMISWDDIIERERSRYEPAADQTPDQAFEQAGERRLILGTFTRMIDGAGGDASSHKTNCAVFYRRYVEPMLDGGPQPSLDVLASDFSLTPKQVRLRLEKMLEFFRKLLVVELAPEEGSPSEAEQKARKMLFGYGS